MSHVYRSPASASCPSRCLRRLKAKSTTGMFDKKSLTTFKKILSQYIFRNIFSLLYKRFSQQIKEGGQHKWILQFNTNCAVLVVKILSNCEHPVFRCMVPTKIWKKKIFLSNTTAFVKTSTAINIIRIRI